MALDTNRLTKPLKKLRKLVKKIGRKPPPGKIHSLRTNTRRIEAMFDAFHVNGSPRDPVLRPLKRCRKRAGKVREMDVLTRFASTLHPRGEDECMVQLLERLGSKRRKYARRLYSEIRRDQRTLHKNLQPSQPAAQRPEDPENDAAAIALRLAAELGTPERLGRTNLHPYRLKIKQLRNILRLASRHTKLVDDLGQVKDAIGEWHDWEELGAFARKVLDHGPRCGILREIKRAAQQKYDRALRLAIELRRKYLRRSGSSPADAVWEAIATLTE